ncbi:putative pleckstrin homology domain-containing family N member 1 isoform X2 [Brachyhypopomus gauderio]|uniref:putative pleckstrin homology domain-containing family N member 1 isoform X2 n=1 Tax=Brachyhypopomus gauderio TaxID=698409 RepID=UPI0040430840
MGCCSVTQRTTGIDDVGPDELELLEIGGAGVWSLGESKQSVSTRNQTEEPARHRPPVRRPEQEVSLWEWSRDELHRRLYTQPVREWEGQDLHSYGDIIFSSRLSLHNGSTKVGERYVVLFSFHLLILALDNLNQNFIYEGILPLSAINVQCIPQQNPSAPPMFEITGPMVDSRTFVCGSAAERNGWLENIEDRRQKSLRQQLSPSHSALSYLLPCNERWQREELKRFLLRCPIWQWEGTPIQHMGQPSYLSLVHISNIQRQGSQERLFVLFPQDLLILSVDSQRVHVKYEGRLPRRSMGALESSALPGRFEFKLTGELMEPLLVSCAYPEDYQSWIFQLQQPEKVTQAFPSHATPPLIPKKRRS